MQAEGVAQVVEYMLCKHKSLNSKPSPTPLKKKKASRIDLYSWETWEIHFSYGRGLPPGVYCC